MPDQLADAYHLLVYNLFTLTGVAPPGIDTHVVFETLSVLAQDEAEDLTPLEHFDPDETGPDEVIAHSFNHFEEVVAMMDRSPDRSASLRCIRIARLAAADAMEAKAEHSPLAVVDLMRQCHDNIRAAYWQARAAAAV